HLHKINKIIINIVNQLQSHPHCEIYTILPKVLGHPSKSLDSGVPITSMATGMQIASTNICERMGRSHELS
ncbi:unnamed protein product, partial [Staurois parvus]